MNVTNAIESSCVGQKMIDAGTHASGGIGRKTSNTGKPMPNAVRFTASNNPNGMPTSIAVVNPASTRSELLYQLCQYPASVMTPAHACRTSVGAGTAPIQG